MNENTTPAATAATAAPAAPAATTPAAAPATTPVAAPLQPLPTQGLPPTPSPAPAPAPSKKEQKAQKKAKAKAKAKRKAKKEAKTLKGKAKQQGQSLVNGFKAAGPVGKAARLVACWAIIVVLMGAFGKNEQAASIRYHGAVVQQSLREGEPTAAVNAAFDALTLKERPGVFSRAANAIF